MSEPLDLAAIRKQLDGISREAAEYRRDRLSRLIQAGHEMDVAVAIARSLLARVEELEREARQ